MTEQVPALLALRTELAWLPKDMVTVLYLGSKWQAELVQHAGFSESQLREYNPCKVYSSELVYTASVPDSKAAELLLQTRAAVLPSGFGGGSTSRGSAYPVPLTWPDPALSALACFEGGGANPRIRVLVIERRCAGKGVRCEGDAAARGRSITNYDEVLEALRAVLPPSDGFAFCSFQAEEHTVRLQAEHFEAADLVIGAIGAGLTNLIFMRPGSLVVALHPSSPETSFSVYSSRCGQSYFWHMAAQLGLEYRAFLCEDMTVFEGGSVDVDDFERFLRAEIRPLLLSSSVHLSMHGLIEGLSR